MSTRFASRLDVVQPSATLAVSARAAALKAQGRTIYGYGVGEPDFDTPEHIRNAAKLAIDRGATRYTAVSGIPELRKAIAEESTRRRGVPCTPDRITVSVGAKHALFNLALALYEPGDEVIVPAPYWVSYPEQIRMFGAEAKIVETREEDGFLLTPDALAGALSRKTKAVILCTPSNPTGSAYSETALRGLCEVLERHDCWLVVDEIYAALVYEGFSNASALTVASPALRERIIVIDGVSKSYAMTGWRIGWSITPPSLARALDMVQGQSTTNPTAVAQAAALAAITGPGESIEAMRLRFETRRKHMVGLLREIPGVRCRMPEGAFYAFADVRGLYGLPSAHAANGRIESDIDVATFLLEEAGAAAVPGSAFGAPGYLRFSYATNEETISAGLAAAKAAVEKAKG